MDPLLLLREHTIKGELDAVRLSEGRVEYGDSYSFPKSTLTAFKSKNAATGFYSIETILHCVKNRGVPAGTYIKLAKSENITPVTFVDRKDLEAYLTGQVDTLDNLHFDAPEVLNQEGLSAPASKRARHETADPGARTADGAGPLSKEVDDDDMKPTERQLRDRNSMLDVPGKKFDRVLAILEDLTRKRRRAAAQKKLQNLPKPAKEAGKQLPVKPSGRFDRDTTANQLQQYAGSDFAAMDINVYGVTSKVAASGAVDPKQRSSRPQAPPSSRSARPPSGSSRHAHKSSRSGSGSGSGKGGIPIIIVPAAITALINMYNVQSFLEDGVFKTVEQARAEAGGTKRSMLVIKRTILRDKPVHYHIVDKPPPKGHKDWRRVVGVIAQGANWQFKEFPFKGASSGNLVDLFQSIAGFYISYRDEPVSDLVKSWHVKRLTVDKVKRHMDGPTMKDLFAHLDLFLAAKGCTLAY